MWFTLNNVKLNDQPKYLVAIVGTEALDLIIDLCYPDKPESVAISTIERLVEEHLSPRRSVIAERMIFRSCRQTESQSISEYLVQLKKLSKVCKFKSNDLLKENLRDQFVFGLLSDRIRQRVLTEPDDAATYGHVTELALSLEAAVRDSGPAAAAGQLRAGGADAVHAVSGGGGRAPWQQQQQQRRGARRPAAAGGGSAAPAQRCYRCDRHHAGRCSFINSECYVCGKKGHIAKVCRSRGGRRSIQ